MYLQDEESLIDSELPQHVTFPRRSLSNNNLPDRKNVGHINRSEMYNSLLKRSATSQDVVTVAKADNTQHTLINKPPLYDEQSFPNDTNNTTGLVTIFIISYLTCIYYSTTQYKPMANETRL